MSFSQTYLGRIIAAHRSTAAQDSRSLAGLSQQASEASAPLDFTAAISQAPSEARASGSTGASAGSKSPNVIAEIKRKSPSKGVLNAELDAATLGSAYAQGGATALSVLTDQEFFAGSMQDLVDARQASRLPTLRKDFTVCEHDVYDARIMGADAVLLIVAALSQEELRRFIKLAAQVELSALVEVHSAAELELALEAGATLVGVNQRDLLTFEVDPERAQELSAQMPPDIVRVAESGIRNAQDVHDLGEAGYDAVLVGETLVTSSDPAAELVALRGPFRSDLPG